VHRATVELGRAWQINSDLGAELAQAGVAQRVAAELGPRYDGRSCSAPIN
jgi:hypothetical protein